MTLFQLPVIFHPSTEKLTGPNYTREDKRVETSVKTNKNDKREKKWLNVVLYIFFRSLPIILFACKMTNSRTSLAFYYEAKLIFLVKLPTLLTEAL